MNKFLPLGLLCFFVFAPVTLATADLNVAVVDLGKVFHEFYKYKEFSTKIDQEAATFQKEIEDQIADYQHMSDDEQKLEQAANDQTLTAATRADRAAALQQKKQDLLNMANKIQEMKIERKRELDEETMRRSRDLLDEINKTISDYSGPKGFDLVLDKSSASAASGVPIVLFNSGKLTDITTDILTRLNQTAPAGTGGAPSGAAVPSPAPGVSTQPATP